MSPTLMILAAVYGAAAGALLPRPVHRLSVEPDQDWRADCPQGHPLTGPAHGWLGAARCRPCGAAYGPGAGATAAVTAPVCAALAAATGPRPELAAWLLMAPVAVLLAAVDLRVRRLPDALTATLAVLAAAGLGGAAQLGGAAGSWRRAVLGGLLLGGCYLLLFVANPGGIGLGDAKLAVGLGTALGWYGWHTLLLGAAAGIALGALRGCWLLLAGRRREAMPLGPYLIAGALCGLLPAAAAAA
ncbi:prepilin peptidase [Streptomyces sp. NPDC014733]|uniref:prepilin peptidase n=1 Tax=Streptomyces sp. NPDC014733 TaxID=3364885 RepID=UPI0036F54A86